MIPPASSTSQDSTERRADRGRQALNQTTPRAATELPNQGRAPGGCIPANRSRYHPNARRTKAIDAQRILALAAVAVAKAFACVSARQTGSPEPASPQTAGSGSVPDFGAVPPTTSTTDHQRIPHQFTILAGNTRTRSPYYPPRAGGKQATNQADALRQHRPRPDDHGKGSSTRAMRNH